MLLGKFNGHKYTQQICVKIRGNHWLVGWDGGYISWNTKGGEWSNIKLWEELRMCQKKSNAQLNVDTSLYSEVNWKSYCIHFLNCPAQLSWLDFTVLYRLLRCVTLGLLCWYEPKWGDMWNLVKTKINSKYGVNHLLLLTFKYLFRCNDLSIDVLH